MQQNQGTDIFTIYVNKIVVSDRVSCNKGKNWWYIVSYQVDGEMIRPLFIKTPKDIFSFDVSEYVCHSMFLGTREDDSLS